MENILNSILANIELAIAIVAAIGALITAGIVQYRRIRDMLNGKALDEFKEIAVPFVGTAENSPLSVLNGLISIPRTEHGIPLTQKTANTNEGKALIVGQAAIEKAQKEKPSILKKLGINSAADAVPLVSSLYKLIKPLVKK